ncbi:MAG TPA: hypothetical protein VFH61_02455, partial [Thermoleophilia bacterium]|nr:hypothetical protein [Thermoleophilia bacterium]
NMTDLGNVLAALKQSGGGGNGSPDIQRIENVPGRRVAFDELVAIKIDANDTSVRTGTITISQEGPFVAVARYASFLSQYSFEVKQQDGSIANFLGRTNGRWRPVHSASDMMDAFLPADTQRLVAFPGTGAPSYSSPALHAPARSMEFDARITMLNQGSAFPRSNIPVPSSFYSTYINSPFQLAALDFFARADVIEFRVQPQHVNNPNSGNLFGFGAGGVMPFSDAQFDHHEGIADPENLLIQPGDPDPVTRLPEGILLIGLHGYRIIQPPGAVVNLGSV